MIKYKAERVILIKIHAEDGYHSDEYFWIHDNLIIKFDDTQGIKTEFPSVKSALCAITGSKVLKDYQPCEPEHLKNNFFGKLSDLRNDYPEYFV